MTSPISRHLAVAGTYNIRDLGGFATPRATTVCGRFLRADSLHRLDATGMAHLVEAGVRLVIDLRHASELETSPNPFADHDHVAYRNISLLSQLAITTEVVADPLINLYRRVIDEQTYTIVQVFEAIAGAGDGAVLFHCTAGKDRTGLITALLLGLVDVSSEHIVDDYAMTARLIEPLVEELLVRAKQAGLDETNFRSFLAAHPDTMQDTLAHIERRYGTVRDYLLAIGVSLSALKRVEARLLSE